MKLSKMVDVLQDVFLVYGDVSVVWSADFGEIWTGLLKHIIESHQQQTEPTKVGTPSPKFQMVKEAAKEQGVPVVYSGNLPKDAAGVQGLPKAATTRPTAHPDDVKPSTRDFADDILTTAAEINAQMNVPDDEFGHWRDDLRHVSNTLRHIKQEMEEGY